MRLPLLISLNLLLLVAAQNLRAQLLPADDFFNGGAQFYISNNIPAALDRVESGLKVYPDDEKLKKLEQLLKQQQKQQQQNQQQQKQQQQSKNNQQENQQQQQNQSQQQKDQQKQNKQNQSEQQKQQAQQKQQQQSAADKQKAEQEKKQQGEGQPLKPGQMTPEEAKHLLDAQKDNEQILQMKPKQNPDQNQQPVKDW